MRAVVVTGRGRAFCAGFDLGPGESAFDYSARTDASSHRDRGGQVALAVHACRKPVLGAINGPAVGFGATCTLPMDVRLASTEARIGFVFSRRGIVPESCSTWSLPRLVGMSRALEWVVTGRVLTADEALAGGLVRSVHRPEELLPAAYSLAEEISQATSAVSVAAAPEMLWRGLASVSPLDAHLLESALMYERGRSADAREGVAAFLEKRQARFPDRVSQDFPAVLKHPGPGDAGRTSKDAGP